MTKSKFHTKNVERIKRPRESPMLQAVFTRQQRTKNKDGDTHRRLIAFNFVFFQKHCSQLLHLEFFPEFVQQFVMK